MYTYVGVLVNVCMYTYVGVLVNVCMYTYVGVLVNARMYTYVGVLVNVGVLLNVSICRCALNLMASKLIPNSLSNSLAFLCTERSHILVD
jgi:hypothetical protein